MIQESVQFQENDILQIETFVFDHLQFHVNQLKILVLDIIIAKENLILMEVHHVQGTLFY